MAQCVQARPLPDPSEERQQVAEHKEQIEGWLKRERPLRLTEIHRLLKREGLSASYPTLRRYAIAELGWHQKEGTVRIEDAEPAQEAQVDFGRMGYLVDAETKRRVTLWALIITLVYSRYMYVWPTLQQTTVAVCEGLDRAWWFFGGMVRVLITDNAKAMIKDPDALKPRLTDAFADYVQGRGLFADPARVRAPKDKARVENQVPYVREDWFDGEEFASLEEARRSAEQWSRDIAGARIHGTTRKVPREVYEASEKPLMLPPPVELYDVPQFAAPTVHPVYALGASRTRCRSDSYSLTSRRCVSKTCCYCCSSTRLRGAIAPRLSGGQTLRVSIPRCVSSLLTRPRRCRSTTRCSTSS